MVQNNKPHGFGILYRDQYNFVEAEWRHGQLDGKAFILRSN